MTQPAGTLREKLMGSRVVRAGGTAGAIRATGLFIALILQLLLARIIADPVQYGIYAWAQNLIFLLGAVFALGIPMATSRLVAIQAGRNDLRAIGTLRRVGARWLIVSSLGGACIGLSIIAVLPDSAFASLPRTACIAAIAAAPLVTYMLYLQGLARAQSRLLTAFGPTQVIRPALTAVYALLVFWLIDPAPGAIEIILAVCAAIASIVLLQLALELRTPVTGRSNDATADDSPEPADTGADQLIGSALPIFATRIADLLIKHGSTLLLGILGGPAAAAAYFVADRLAQLATVPRSVVGSVVQPWLASDYAENDRQGLQRTVRHAGHATFWPTALAVGGLLVVGALLLQLFGREYVNAYPVMAILLVAHLVGAALGPAQQVLIMSGLQKLVMNVMAVAAISHVAALLVLIPWLGATGAALATLISTAVARVGCLALVRSRLSLDPSVLGDLRRRLGAEDSEKP